MGTLRTLSSFTPLGQTYIGFDRYLFTDKVHLPIPHRSLPLPTRHLPDMDTKSCSLSRFLYTQ